jgi:DNA gyrase subunit B
MPLQRRLTDRGEEPGRGYEMVWANGRERWEHTHHLADAFNLDTGRTSYRFGPVRHHVDFNKRNNDPRNIRRMRSEAHIALHATHAALTLAPVWQDPEFRERKLRQMSESARLQWQDPAYRRLKSEQARRQRVDPAHAAAILQGFQQYLADLAPEQRAEIAARLDAEQQAYWADPQNRAAAADARIVRKWWQQHPEHADKVRAGLQRNWADPAFPDKVGTALRNYRENAGERHGAVIREGHRRKGLRLLYDAVQTGKSLPTAYESLRLISAPTAPCYATLVGYYGGDDARLLEAASNHNHRVLEVRPLSDVADVYDVTVEFFHNFALEAGVFVHNSAKGGREARYQAILPIRGKILNVEKARIDRVLGNNEVQAMITALGCGIHEEFDASKLRYHKVVLMADADVDGQHIRTLLLTLLFRFMRPLVEQGYVYLAQPPLYKIKWNGGEIMYAYSDRERDGLIAAGKEAGKKLPKSGEAVQRFKGLGEMNAEELWSTTMDPATRVLLQVTLDDAATADELFSTLMGEDVEARRSFIQRNARDVRFLDI